MKRVFLLLLAVLMIATSSVILTACGDEETPADGGTTTKATTTTSKKTTSSTTTTTTTTTKQDDPETPPVTPDVIEIDTKLELLDFMALANTESMDGKTIKLTADITLNDTTAAEWYNDANVQLWTPIKDFKGTFDGQGFAIHGLCIKETITKKIDTNIGIAMFASVRAGSVIKNLALIDEYVLIDHNSPTSTMSTFGAGLVASDIGEAGKPAAKVTSCLVNGTVIFKTAGAQEKNRCIDGGMIGGWLNTTEITNCYATGSITLGTSCGGGLLVSGLGASVQKFQNNYAAVTGTIAGDMWSDGACVARWSGIYLVKIGDKPTALCRSNQEKLVAGENAILASADAYAATSYPKFDFTNTWVAQANGTPVLKVFADQHAETLADFCYTVPAAE